MTECTETTYFSASQAGYLSVAQEEEATDIIASEDGEVEETQF